MTEDGIYRTAADRRTLPNKPLGAHYAVLLRHANFSLAKVALSGAVGVHGKFPAPQMGERCACCNALHTRHVMFDASTDRLTVEPLRIPACADCATHLKTSTKSQQAWAIGFCVLVPAALFAASKEQWEVFAGIFVATAMLCAFMLALRRRKIRMAKQGHHPFLEIMAHVGQCVVRTTNARLAEELVSRHDREVFRVR